MRRPYWELRVPGGNPRGNKPRNPIVLGRKFCAGCGRWRHACDFDLKNGRLRERCRVCILAYNRAWRARRTEEQRERDREYYRIWADAKRRAAGKPTRRHPNSVVNRIERLYFDAAPVRELLSDLPLGELERLIERTGIPERSVNRLRNGESRHVRIDLADRIAIALGIPLMAVYGPDVEPRRDISHAGRAA